MPRKPQDVTDAELAIMEYLWENQTSTALALSEIIYGATTASNVATVQKLLKRLENKGCIKRNRSTWPHQFTALLDRDGLIERRLQNTAIDLCQGSMTPLLTHLIRVTRLSRKDRNELRNLLDELGKNGGSSATNKKRKS
jgi:predicted transcriptional regulator